VSEAEKALEEILVSRLLRLNATVLGLVSGILFGGGIFVATNWLVLKGGAVVGPHLGLLGQYFIGYRVSFVGSFIGLAYGFFVGYVVGYAIAILYNLFVRLREAGGKAEADRRSR
jgi:hypothetical protein